MIEFIFSGVFNFLFTLCLIIILLVGFEFKKILNARSQGKTTFRYSESGPELPIEKEFKEHKEHLIKLCVAAIVLYLLGNGLHTPVESMRIYEQKELAQEQEKLERDKRKAQEKAEKERQRQEQILIEQEKERQKEQEKIDKENADKNNHDFIEISAQSLMNELALNAARANKNFNGKYVKITNALVTNIDSDGDYINVDYDERISLTSIQCFSKYDSTKEQIFNLNKYQWITVYGKIQDVGEIIGYHLELLKIE